MADIEKDMENLKEGKISALEQIYAQTKNAVFAIAFSILKNYQSAEDIMQDTYIKVSGNIHTYKKGTNARYWIYTIARNAAINCYNRQKFESLTDFDERPDIHNFEEICLKDESGIFRIMGEALDENERKIVTMHTLGGIRLNEIADLMEKPQGTIRWQYNNALKKLQKKLEGETIL